MSAVGWEDKQIGKSHDSLLGGLIQCVAHGIIQCFLSIIDYVTYCILGGLLCVKLHERLLIVWFIT